MKILLIEDKDSDISAFRDSVDAWNIGKPEPIEVESCKTLESAASRLSSSDDLDGIVLDLKLPHDTRGEEVFNQLGKLYLRIPVVVLSGTPAELADEYQVVCLNSYVKAEQHEKEILDLLWDCKQSGLMKLIGGKGLFEKQLKTVFDKCIVPRFDEWREVLATVGGEHPEVVTVEALKRHILSCLNLILATGEDKIQPEECYISLTEDSYSYPLPGMIVSDNSGLNWLVLNPACDLALRTETKQTANGTTEEIAKPKTQHVFLVEVEPATAVLQNRNSGDKKKCYANNADLNIHWLPSTKSFSGGFANFRKVRSVLCEGFFDNFQMQSTRIVVHPDVLKNIQSRFANYYARQGQPDVAYDRFL
jgi:CheY-like chemotaxis protein